MNQGNQDISREKTTAPVPGGIRAQPHRLQRNCDADGPWRFAPSKPWAQIQIGWGVGVPTDVADKETNEN